MLAQLRSFVVQLALVVAATLFARAVYLDVNFIPRLIMHGAVEPVVEEVVQVHEEDELRADDPPRR